MTLPRKPPQRFNIMVPVRDGVRLATDLYLPEGHSPFPTLIGRTSYNKNSEAVRKLAERWTAKGYAFVIQDCRGRGDSEGSFSPYVNEGPDGHDAIEWVAGQDWCDGRVILLGASYGAKAGWLTALRHPQHLFAMVIAVSPSDPFVEHPTSSVTPMAVCWHRLVDRRVAQNADGVDWMRVYEHLPLIELDERAGFVSSSWKQSVEHAILDDFWERHRYQNRLHELDVPVMHISGWYDDEQVGTPLNFLGMIRSAKSKRTRAAQRLLMGPWGHAINTTSKLGEVEFGSHSLIDLEGYVSRWLDALMERGGGDIPRVRLFVMGANEWRDEPEWPPPGARPMEFFLHSGGAANSRFGDGTMARHGPADEPSDVYVYDPARPVPFITEAKSSQIGGPDDYAAIEQRADVLCYTSEPMTEDTEVTGPVRLVLFASSTAVDTDFMAKLVDVHPTGFCQRLCDGAVRGRFRDGWDRETFLEPGEVYEFDIDLWNTSQVFKAGHRIRLEIASSAFPKYDRNLNTGEPIATGTRMVPAENRIWHDAQRPSRLILPIVAH